MPKPALSLNSPNLQTKKLRGHDFVMKPLNTLVTPRHVLQNDQTRLVTGDHFLNARQGAGILAAINSRFAADNYHVIPFSHGISAVVFGLK
jgi:hypothetical protein